MFGRTYRFCESMPLLLAFSVLGLAAYSILHYGSHPPPALGPLSLVFWIPVLVQVPIIMLFPFTAGGTSLRFAIRSLILQVVLWLSNVATLVVWYLWSRI